MFAAIAFYDLDGQLVWQHELLVVELMQQQHLNALSTLALQSLGPKGAGQVAQLASEGQHIQVEAEAQC